MLLSNDAASDAELKNQELKNLHQAYADSETSKSRTEAQRQQLDKLFPRPKSGDIILGSNIVPASDLVSIQISGGNAAKPVTIPVRPLAASVTKPGLVRLNAENQLELFYGIDAGSLEKLKNGSYTFNAVVKSAGNGDSRQGATESNPVSVTLADPIVEGNSRYRHYLYGRFYLLDHNYDEAEKCAQKILSENPSSINGMEMHADAAFGKGNLTEAKEAFQRAIKLYDAKWTKAKLSPSQIVEPPEYLQNRLHQVIDLIEKQEKVDVK